MIEGIYNNVEIGIEWRAPYSTAAAIIFVIANGYGRDKTVHSYVSDAYLTIFKFIHKIHDSSSLVFPYLAIVSATMAIS